MGSSAPKSETKINPGKTQLVVEQRPRTSDVALSELANYWQNKALEARSSRQSLVNSYLGHYGVQAPYAPLTTTEGRTFTPNVVSEPFDATALVPPESFYKLPRQGGGQNKPKEPREAYKDAVVATRGLPANAYGLQS